MPQIGPLEVLIVAALALIVFGPEKLPDMARSLGKGVTQFKRMATDVKSEFDLNLQEDSGDKPADRRADSDGAAPADADVDDGSERPAATV